MEPGDWARKVLDIIESETRDLVQSGAPTPESETDVEIAPLVQKIGATSIAEVEKVISELQAAKDFLDCEGERVQREAGHPLREHSRSSQFDLTLSSTEDNTTSAPVQEDQHQLQSQRPFRARNPRKQSPETTSGKEQSSPA